MSDPATPRRGRRSLAGKRALVTGASGGIGRALAVELAHRGASSVLMARNTAALDETVRLVAAANGVAIPVVGDVTDPAARKAALTLGIDSLGGLDLLVNNAGVGAHGRLLDAPPERLRSLFEVNFFAAVELTREAVPLLSAGDDPAVVNIGSVLGWRGLPQDCEYCASKFALRGLSQSLRPEIARLGIGLLHVSPSTTESGFLRNLVQTQVAPPWGKLPGVSSEFVARCTLNGLERRRNEVTPGLRARAMLALNRWAPWLLDRALAKYG